jgi:hypothetical protein
MRENDGNFSVCLIKQRQANLHSRNAIGSHVPAIGAGFESLLWHWLPSLSLYRRIVHLCLIRPRPSAVFQILYSTSFLDPIKKQLNFSCTPWRYMGGVEVKLHVFLASVLDLGDWLPSLLRPLYHKRNSPKYLSGTHRNVRGLQRKYAFCRGEEGWNSIPRSSCL